MLHLKKLSSKLANLWFFLTIERHFFCDINKLPNHISPSQNEHQKFSSWCWRKLFTGYPWSTLSRITVFLWQVTISKSPSSYFVNEKFWVFSATGGDHQFLQLLGECCNGSKLPSYGVHWSRPARGLFYTRHHFLAKILFLLQIIEKHFQFVPKIQKEAIGLVWDVVTR